MLVDLVPAGWTVHPTSPELTVSVRPDGQSEVRAPVSLPGTVGAFTPAASRLSYTITADDGADRGRVDLPRAAVSWTDGAVSHSGTSLGATAFTVDVDGDGSRAAREVRGSGGARVTPRERSPPLPRPPPRRRPPS